MLINSKQFPFTFFLAGRKSVESLETGAKLFGGATKTEKGIFSNVQNGDFIEVNEEENEISLFIPSTININGAIDNRFYVEKTIKQLRKNYNLSSIKVQNGKGSWYSDDLKKTVIENIVIVTVEKEKIIEEDINYFISLANEVKSDMKQEGVSISINNALAIV